MRSKRKEGKPRIMIIRVWEKGYGGSVMIRCVLGKGYEGSVMIKYVWEKGYVGKVMIVLWQICVWGNGYVGSVRKFVLYIYIYINICNSYYKFNTQILYI